MSQSVLSTECAALNERLERQATEFANEKTTLQEHFNEYKDRLVTMSDDNPQANRAQREAEKTAATCEQKTKETERENQRLNHELANVKGEVRLLTEKLGELRGQLSATEKRLTDDRESIERLLAEKDERSDSLSESLKESQRLVRQYVPKGKNLAQELTDERTSDHCQVLCG